MKQILYDDAILQQYADQLYSQARWIILTTALKYAFVAFVVAFLALAASDVLQHPAHAAPTDPVPALLLAAFAALVGVEAGRRKAFLLRLEAQKVLCDRQIELNTRA